MSEEIDGMLKDYAEANDMSFAGIIKLILHAITFLDQKLDKIEENIEKMKKMKII